MEVVVTSKPNKASECLFSTHALSDYEFTIGDKIKAKEDTKKRFCMLNNGDDDMECPLDNGGTCPFLKDISTAIIESGLIDANSYNPVALFNTMQQALNEAQKEDG